VIHGLPFVLWHLVYLDIIDRLAHAKSDALRVTFTEVTFLDHVFVSIHVDISERTSLHAHLAPQASAFIDDDRVGFWTRQSARLHAFAQIGFHTGLRAPQIFFRIEWT
jgi:hypothetical protein